MKKIYIVGIVASGKTTFAKKLSVDLDIPWFELDCIVHHKTENERYKRTPEQQVEVINDINKSEKWIIEGTYRKSCHCLLDMADTIIFLDPPLWKRKLRIFTRFIKQQLGYEKCHYKSDFKMLKLMYKWTNEFEKNRKEFIDMLNRYSGKLLIASDKTELDLTKI